MPYNSFKELKVWQEAKAVAVEIYRVSTKGLLARDFGLRDQMQRASVSIAANIAEGYDRTTPKEFSRFLDIARGSAAELRTQLDIALAVGYIDKNTFDKLDDQCMKIGAMITKLKRTLTS
jgi:four helix bundle protein